MFYLSLSSFLHIYVMPNLNKNYKSPCGRQITNPPPPPTLYPTFAGSLAHRQDRVTQSKMTNVFSL